jgi:hypothetical protein
VSAIETLKRSGRNLLRGGIAVAKIAAMHRILLVLSLAPVMLASCDDTVCIPGDDEAGSPNLACDLDPGLSVDKPVDCMILGCSISRPEHEWPLGGGGSHATCSFVVWLPEGSDGDIGVRLPGGSELPWNELPWNLEGGGFENSYLVGEGMMCGGFEIDLPDASPEYIEMSCTNWGSDGGFDTDQWTP